MSFTTNFFGLKSLAVIAGFVFSVSSAQAVPLSFTQITSNGSAGGVDQLSVDVTNSVDGLRALFSFSAIAGVNPDINVTEIYFDDRTPLFTTPLNIVSQSGTDFTGGAANPGHLPGGNAVGFQTTAGLLADSANGNTGGLQIGDGLTIGLDYQAGLNFADLITSLNDGSFRIGMHVRSHFGGGSEGYVNTAPGGGGGVIFTPVPLPAGLPLLLSAFGIAALLHRKSRKAAQLL